MKQDLHIKHLVIIGVGLIGGSVARRLRKDGVVSRITGVGRGTKNLQQAVALGVIDRWTHDVSEAVKDADMIVVSVPMGAFADVFRDIALHAPGHAVISDVGSTKTSALHAAKQAMPRILSRFVPAHPIAGTEQSGVDASFDTLFDGRLCIITPHNDMDDDAYHKVLSMWQSLGSTVMKMSTQAHDQLLASVSHLPHVAAFALVNCVQHMGEGQAYDPFQFAAGGFRDFTRIASSSPSMWRDIALNNRDALLQVLDAYQQELQLLRGALADENSDALLSSFEQAKHTRDQWLKTYGETL